MRFRLTKRFFQSILVVITYCFVVVMTVWAMKISSQREKAQQDLHREIIQKLDACIDHMRPMPPMPTYRPGEKP